MMLGRKYGWLDIDTETGRSTMYGGDIQTRNDYDIGELALYVRQGIRETGFWKQQQINVPNNWNYQAVKLGRIEGDFQLLFYASRYHFITLV